MKLSLDSPLFGGARCRLAGLFLSLLLGVTGVSAQTPAVLTTHDAYAVGEDIAIQFRNGPGNIKDWVGIYPLDVVPGGPASTRWFYVDGTGSGQTGVKEGLLTFTGGLNFAGDWKAYFLLNNGYDILAETSFKVVDAGTPLVRTDQRTYVPGQNIVINFVSGPGNAKDWVGIYKAGETPGGGPDSTIWNYVDGTRTGSTGLAEGTFTFTGGLTAIGDYVAFFLLDDGYTVLATESFTVVAPSENKPRVLSVSPADGATGVGPRFQFSASITNGASKVVTSSIVLTLDGTTVNATKSSVNDLTTVTYAVSALQAPSSTHSYKLTFQDDATPANNFEVNGTFTIAVYEDLQLPAPLVFENFDATPEGQLPAGWTTKSYTEILNTELDLGNLDSASFANWVVLDVNRFTGSFVTYSNPDNPEGWENDYQRVLTPNPLNVVNGQVVSPLATGRMLFGNSGYRQGSSQVLFTFTPDFDLTGKTNVYLVFNSLYEQNQDSIGALEYSVDGGTAWLPVAYLINSGDIVRTEAGDVDAEATLTTPAGDIAVYLDDNGAEQGGTYGAFIAAPISPALAPYIQARIDDNALESKRVEKYRLPLADNQKTVRLRFAYAGTDSWYWGIDNLGLYSIGSTPAVPPALIYGVSPTGLTLTWPADATGYVLEAATALGQTSWAPVNGVTGNSATVPFSASAEFFRLRKP